MYINLTENACERIRKLISSEDNSENSFLRISVLSGGCSGFQYQIHMDHNLTGDDKEILHMGAKVVIDDMSLDLIKGATLDYVENLASAKFVISNPNASSGCGCGNSFAL